MLRAENLHKTYGKRKVVKGVNIQVEPGKVVGLLGPNGAGKTTCFYMIVGLIPADEGRILVDETDITHQREKLEDEIKETQTTWENKKKDYKETQIEEQKTRAKERKREEDEYTYNLHRSRSLEENNYADKLTALEKEIEGKRETIDKHVEEKTVLLNDREQLLAQREQTMETLERSVESYPTELKTAVNSAIEQKETELSTSFNQEKALLTKGAEGDQKVLETKISAFESLVSDQARQIEKLNNQQEKAYQQVQDIASKAVIGAAERPQAITVKTVERDGHNL